MVAKLKRINKPRRALTTKKGKLKRLASIRGGVDVSTTIKSRRGRQSFAQQAALGQPQTAQQFTLESTAIAAVAYDEKRQILEIAFVRGGTWIYWRVPEIHAKAFNSSFVGSKGRYFHNHIYGKWTGKPGNKKYTPRYNERRVR